MASLIDVDVQSVFNVAVGWFTGNRYYLSVGGKTLCYDFETDGWSDCGYGYIASAVTVDRYTFPSMTFLASNWKYPVVGDQPESVAFTHGLLDADDPTVSTEWVKQVHFRAMDGEGFPRQRKKRATRSRNWGKATIPVGLTNQGTVSMVTENEYIESYPIQMNQYEVQYICDQKWSQNMKGALLELILDFDKRMNPELSDYLLEYVPEN